MRVLEIELFGVEGNYERMREINEFRGINNLGKKSIKFPKN